MNGTHAPGRYRSMVLGALTATLIIGLIGGGLLALSGAHLEWRSAAAQDATTSSATVMDAVALVEQVAPAVVTVNNLQRIGGFGASDDPQRAGTGTGFIIDDAGHIVTNWHVVEGGDSFEVIFADGEERPAELVGMDQISDLAVVKVAGPVPATVPLGESDQLKVGQPVLAVGSALGEFTNTVTEGIVSALERDFPQNVTNSIYSNLIQHDAAINPGNSGGPLFNAAGEVVGVNTLGIPEGQGLFFAVPANTVREITTALIESGEVAYPALGIYNPETVNSQVASQYDLPVDYGVIFSELVPDGPAAQAGIEVGDIILAINGNRIERGNSLPEVLFAHEPGETVDVLVRRGADELHIDVTLDRLQR